MKIYLVTYGCYSDYSIERAFLSKEKAFCWAAAENSKSNSRDFCVEEYETSDDSFITDGKVETQVHFKVTVVASKVKSINRNETGVVFKIQRGDLWGTPLIEYHEPQIHEFVSGYHWGVDIWVGLYDTEEKIIKIAQDLYYRWKAEHELEFVPEEHTLYLGDQPTTIVQFCNHSEKEREDNNEGNG